MTTFDSLNLALENWFECSFGDLPDALRQRVEREFFPMPWEKLSVEQRRSVARQMDYQRDPATQKERQFWFDFFLRKDDLKAQIAKWESTATPTASDLATSESRLKQLHQELARMDAQERQGRGDYAPARARSDADGDAIATLQGLPVCYIAYPKAMHQLRRRLDATPEELAAWIWKGPKDGGVAAFLNANEPFPNANELDPPQRFFFTPGAGYFGDVDHHHDYVAPLMACWFREDEIARFQPVDRYITGKELIARWREKPGLQAEAFILAKIGEARLEEFHPIWGLTRGSCPEETDLPPMETGLHRIADVEAVEAEDFAVDHDQGNAATHSGPMEYGPAPHAGSVIARVLDAGGAKLLLPTAPTGMPTDHAKKISEHVGPESKIADGIQVVSKEAGAASTQPVELPVGSSEWRKRTARAAANALHDKPGGSRDKQTELRNIWASGKYSDRNACAEQECGALRMAFSTARKALANTPDPDRS